MEFAPATLSELQVLAAMVALLRDRGVEAPEHSFATCLLVHLVLCGS